MQLPLFNSSPSGGRSNGRVETLRARTHELFTGTSAMGSRDREAPEPKSPRPVGSRGFSHSSLEIFGLRVHALPRAHARSPPSPVSPPSRLARPRRASLDSTEQALSTPASVYFPSRTQYVGADAEETYLAQLMHAERQRGHARSRASIPRTCLPFSRNPALRNKIISCVLSGALLVSVLAIYLSLALSNHIIRQEYHIVLILIILLITIFFCHSLIRLCMLAIAPDSASRRSRRNRVPSIAGPGGYADPPQPIRVITRHDEEAVGIDSDVTKVPPPAYGLWRCSVRVDPNLLHWQRNECSERDLPPSSPVAPDSPSRRPNARNRPPSYVSDDGVEYLVSAGPRFPVVEERFFIEGPPVHPEEIGRALI